MDRLSASYVALATNNSDREDDENAGDKEDVLSHAEEVELTKLIEYCVLLINQVSFIIPPIVELLNCWYVM